MPYCLLLFRVRRRIDRETQRRISTSTIKKIGRNPQIIGANAQSAPQESTETLNSAFSLIPHRRRQIRVAAIWTGCAELRHFGPIAGFPRTGHREMTARGRKASSGRESGELGVGRVAEWNHQTA
jgi:hypothetical protein